MRSEYLHQAHRRAHLMRRQPQAPPRTTNARQSPPHDKQPPAAPPPRLRPLPQRLCNTCDQPGHSNIFQACAARIEARSLHVHAKTPQHKPDHSTPQQTLQQPRHTLLKGNHYHQTFPSCCCSAGQSALCGWYKLQKRLRVNLIISGEKLMRVRHTNNVFQPPERTERSLMWP